MNEPGAEFFIPTSYGPDGDFGADPRLLHLAGLDDPRLMHGAYDVFPDDAQLVVDNAQDREHEHLPQFGPPFVRFVHEKFAQLDGNLAAREMKRWSYEPTTWFEFASFQSDASGNVTRAGQPNALILEPPPGFTYAMHRLSIAVDTFNFGTPFTVAAGYWELRENDELVDGGSLVSGSGSFPVVRTWGTRDAPHFRDGVVVSLFISGTATFANKRITVKAQGTKKRDIDG